MHGGKVDDKSFQKSCFQQQAIPVKPRQKRLFLFHNPLGNAYAMIIRKLEFALHEKLTLFLHLLYHDSCNAFLPPIVKLG